MPADEKKDVLVVGGGPAGMESARVAALRGHRVTLFEKERKLGGLLHLAEMIKGSQVEDLGSIVRYQKTQLAKLGVNVHLGTELTQSEIETLNPDVVVLATGGVPLPPDIPGIENKIVVPVAKLHRQSKTLLRFVGPGLAGWLTRLWMPVGRRVVFIGGGMQGLELAEELVHELEKWLPEEPDHTKWVMENSSEEYDVPLENVG